MQNSTEMARTRPSQLIQNRVGSGRPPPGPGSAAVDARAVPPPRSANIRAGARAMAPSATRQLPSQRADQPTNSGAAVDTSEEMTLASDRATERRSPWRSDSAAGTMARISEPMSPMRNEAAIVMAGCRPSSRRTAFRLTPAAPTHSERQRPRRCTTRCPPKPTRRMPAAKAVKCRLLTVYDSRSSSCRKGVMGPRTFRK